MTSRSWPYRLATSVLHGYAAMYGESYRDLTRLVDAPSAVDHVDDDQASAAIAAATASGLNEIERFLADHSRRSATGSDASEGPS